MTPDSPLDPEQARNNADEAMKRVEGNADPAWLSRAYAAVVRIAVRQPEFHPDDFWLEMGDDVPDEWRASGPVFRDIAKDGVATPTDVARRSKLKRCHGHWRPVWKSNIYAGAK